MVVEQKLVSGVLMWCQIAANGDGTHELVVSNEAGTEDVACFESEVTESFLRSIGQNLRKFINDDVPSMVDDTTLCVREALDKVDGKLWIKIGKIGYFTRSEAKLLLRTLDKQFQLA